MVRFLDSSVFLHAYLNSKRSLGMREGNKKKAINILENVERGEEVVTSTVHISEIINMIEARLGLDVAIRLLQVLLTIENIRSNLILILCQNINL